MFVMRKGSSIPQIIAWIIFVIENFLVIGFGLQQLFGTKDSSAIPDTPAKVLIYAVVIGIVIFFQALTLIAIFKMDNDSQGWLIFLAVMALLHDPFYFVPVIWEFVIHKRDVQRADF